VFTGYFTQAIGLLGTDANKSAFLCSLTVVLVPFMERTFLGKLRCRSNLTFAPAQQNYWCYTRQVHTCLVQLPYEELRPFFRVSIKGLAL